MRSSLDYAGFAQLCARSPIMRKIMCAYNRIIPRSLIQHQMQVVDRRDRQTDHYIDPAPSVKTELNVFAVAW